MATSTLLQTGEQQPARKGHGTAALGPSDTSDSGSDVLGGPGLYDDPGIGLDRGTHEDIERDSHRSAGQDVGDTNLDSDSDSNGSGERAGAGRDVATRDANDLYPDHVEGGSERSDIERESEPDSLAQEVDAGSNETDIEFGPREHRRP
jgi:hypothetical protein